MSMRAMTSQSALSGNSSGLSLAIFAKKISGRLEQGPFGIMRRYGLRRDLMEPVRMPKARVPISIRLMQAGDLDVLLPEAGVQDPKERTEIGWRRDFYRRFPHGCFVAIDERTGTPCYMQWLLGPGDNASLARLKCFPPLKDGEALLEQAYTHPDYRGRYVMPAAMAMIAERARDIGARYVLTFVEESNVPSLKGCQRAGFQTHILQRRTQIGFGTIIHNRFTQLAGDDPRRTTAFQ